MSKAVLVMDMPDNCADCGLIDDTYNLQKCMATGRHIGSEFNIYDKKIDNCPLRKLPEEDNECYYPDEYEDGYANGWNACIDGLLYEE